MQAHDFPISAKPSGVKTFDRHADIEGDRLSHRVRIVQGRQLDQQSGTAHVDDPAHVITCAVHDRGAIKLPALEASTIGSGRWGGLGLFHEKARER